MQNEDMNTGLELEQLRQQYTELKAYFEKQNDLNEKLVRDSMRKDLRFISTKKWISVAAGVVAIPLITTFSESLGLSTVFMIASIVWMLAMVAGNIIRLRKIDIDRYSGESMQQFLKIMKDRKKSQFRWFRVNTALLIIWIGALVGECLRADISRDILLPLLCGIATGTVIGIIIDLRMHNSIIYTYEGIILELENPDAYNSILK